jgi:hypothetical protein
MKIRRIKRAASKRSWATFSGNWPSQSVFMLRVLFYYWGGRKVSVALLFVFARAAQRGLYLMPHRKKHQRHKSLRAIKYLGQYTFYPSNRIFEALLKIINVMDALNVAIYFTNATDPVAKSELPPTQILQSESFDVDVSTPTKSPMEYLARNELSRFVQIVIIKRSAWRWRMKLSSTTLHAPMIMTGLITPIFVDFFEQHRPFLEDRFGNDVWRWPPIATFAWAIRNFIVHHQGKVNFTNPKAPGVSWHHLSYAPKDKGAKAVGYGGDIGLGDIILLLMEFAGELNGWGCPPLTLTEPLLENLARVHRQGPENPEYGDLKAKFGLPPERPL